MLELLPLGPSDKRELHSFTAYDASTRTYTIAVQSYPYAGMDTFFSVVISNDVKSVTTVNSNVIIAHPDTAINNPGAMSMLRLLQGPKGTLLVAFTDGSVYDLNIASKKYSLLANVNVNGVKDAAPTYAHTMDGFLLKSFVMDSRGESYLIETDTGKILILFLFISNSFFFKVHILYIYDKYIYLFNISFVIRSINCLM